MRPVMITGGSRGIGAASARLAASRGYAVAVNYVRDASAADAVVSAIDSRGGRAIAVQADVPASGGDPGRAERMAPAVPMRRAGTPDEVARAIVWLASSEASYCTGAVVDVSGGR